jgi:hypothetical protein
VPRHQLARPTTSVVRWLLVAVTAVAGLTLWAAGHRADDGHPGAMPAASGRTAAFVRHQGPVAASPAAHHTSGPRAHGGHSRGGDDDCRLVSLSSVAVVTATAVHLPSPVARTTPYAARAPNRDVTTWHRRVLATTVTLTDIGVSRT